MKTLLPNSNCTILRYFGGNDCFWHARDVFMLKEELVFLSEKGIQEEGFSSFQKISLIEITFFPHPYNLRDLMLMKKSTI